MAARTGVARALGTLFTGLSAFRPPETAISSARHPEFEHEQAYIDAAYHRLDEIREEALARGRAQAAERQTSFQAAFERDVAVRAALERAAALEVGEQSLVFGRTDDASGTRYYVGRRAVFDREFRPVVIDWRVPAAEPFYRATGLKPMGLRLRRHFLCEGRALLAIEDEHLGDGVQLGLAGSGALVAAMERPRTGRMSDIVSTIQAEQDEIIRDVLEGVLVVQGGPGTGKTAVGLHRAAYLLFTHRRKLERQGILVVAPNRRFLRYIDQVLPALGEAGVTLATLADLAPRVAVTAEDPAPVARLKGEQRMAEVIARAIAQRRTAPTQGARVDFEGTTVKISARELRRLFDAATRNHRTHNARRSMLLTILVSRVYGRYVGRIRRTHGALASELTLPRGAAMPQLRAHPQVRAALDAMWPLLEPQEVVASLLSSRARLRGAADGVLTDGEQDLLVRPAGASWTGSDVPLLDEAAILLGEPVERRRVASLDDDDDEDEPETMGHVIVDEAQDLSPMALRMIARRSRTGSLTVLGDLAQSLGATTPRTWQDVLAHLPMRDGARVRELTINYRTPGAIMDLAARVLAEAAPDLTPPRAARAGGRPVEVVRGEPVERAAAFAAEHRARGEGTAVVIAARARAADLRRSLAAEADDDTLAVLPAAEAKGLEFDRVLIVEPSELVEEHGLRALYVALTRATHEVTVVSSSALLAVLSD